MADIRLVRLDFRLIHGQVVTQWIKVSGANRVVIANDDLAADDFMGDIYRMAAPAGIKVDIMSVADACAAWKESQLGEGKVLLLLKTAEDAVRARAEGLDFDDLQVGGLGGGAGSVTACGIAFKESDVAALRSLASSGVNVHVHVIPTAADTPLEQAVGKLVF